MQIDCYYGKRHTGNNFEQNLRRSQTVTQLRLTYMYLSMLKSMESKDHTIYMYG